MSIFKHGFFWIFVLVLLFLAVDHWPNSTSEDIKLSKFLNDMVPGAIEETAPGVAPDPNAPRRPIVIQATDRGGEIVGKYLKREFQNSQQVEKTADFKTKYTVGQEEFILMKMLEHNVPYEAKPTSTLFTGIFFSILVPLAFILLFWFIILRPIQGSGNKAMSFGKSRAKLMSEGQTKITFDDVAGVDEAKQELQEIVEFLKDPQKFRRLGGSIPKGVLLVGPPGTGKTLLAKAVAGEANVPFFSISGSDFVEMFVGVGASRVRDLFEQGKKNKPCLIFIDEIDAVGRHRGAGLGGGHDEREQTLNQLLVEMDGFQSNEGVILIAATNRPDVLDPALLRPGRFDRQVTVDLPDVKGREQILKVHLKKIQLARGLDVSRLARATSGFSGADLASMVNEAALLAGRQNKDQVELSDLEEARDRVMMGPERRSLVLSEENKRHTAYHEAGHALCSKLTPGSMPVHKVTIMPRGRALGVTSYLPDKDIYEMEFRPELLNRLITVMGGRAAEIVMYNNEFTAGAAGDIQQATRLCMRMVCEMGMSDKLGPRAYGDGESEVFLGRSMSRGRNFSEETMKIIDEEVRTMIETAHTKAVTLLRENKHLLELVGQALLDRETITGEELDLLIKGETLPPLPTVKMDPDDRRNAPTAKPEKDSRPTFKPSILDRPAESGA